MILEELLGPTNLPKAQTLYIHEVAKFFMIGEYKKFVFAIF